MPINGSFRPEKVESANIKIAKIKKELEYTRNNVPEIGDAIRIINPRPGQEARGTIEDFCRDGKAKIRTPLGKIITRDIKKHSVPSVCPVCHKTLILVRTTNSRPQGPILDTDPVGMWAIGVVGTDQNGTEPKIIKIHL